MAVADPPVLDITLQEMAEDPFTAYAKMRTLGRVVWVPAIGRYAISHYDDIVEMDRHPELFTTRDMDSPMVRSLGDMLMSKDGPAHRRERSAIEPALRPRVILDDWRPIFQKNVDDLINAFIDDGHAELDSQLGARLAARNLADVLGLHGVSDVEMLAWARAIIAGCGNYAQDPETWERNDEARAAVSAAVAEVHPHLEAHSDSSLISSMIHASDPLSLDEICTNVGVLIAGGINEPNHALGISVLGLLLHPEQRAEVEADASGQLWKKVFEEAMRWIAPIGGYPRLTTQAVEFAGTHLQAGAPVIGMIAAANRDGDRYERADAFDIHRDAKPHLAFGSGIHMCLGMWMSRVSIGQVGVPTLIRRLPRLRLVDRVDVVGEDWTTWMFRGLTNLNVEWDVAQ